MADQSDRLMFAKVAQMIFLGPSTTAQVLFQMGWEVRQNMRVPEGLEEVVVEQHGHV
jgi:hypothetical protein